MPSAITIKKLKKSLLTQELEITWHTWGTQSVRSQVKRKRVREHVTGALLSTGAPGRGIGFQRLAIVCEFIKLEEFSHQNLALLALWSRTASFQN